jgi:hypothetical protein
LFLGKKKRKILYYYSINSTTSPIAIAGCADLSLPSTRSKRELQLNTDKLIATRLLSASLLIPVGFDLTCKKRLKHGSRAVRPPLPRRRNQARRHRFSPTGTVTRRRDPAKRAALAPQPLDLISRQLYGRLMIRSRAPSACKLLYRIWMLYFVESVVTYVRRKNLVRYFVSLLSAFRL